MPAEVLEVTHRFMREPIRILVKKEELTLEGIRQFYINIGKEVNDQCMYNDFNNIFVYSGVEI
jgi:translation initiation factor 4A